MRKYVTGLSEDQILEKVMANSLPSKLKNCLTPHVYIFRFKGNRVYLAYTGRWGLAKWQGYLRIKMTEEKNRTFLKCGFAPTIPETVAYIVFWGILAFLPVKMGLYGTYHSDAGDRILISIIFISGLLRMIYVEYGHLLIYHRRAQKALEFVETVLEAKRL